MMVTKWVYCGTHTSVVIITNLLLSLYVENYCCKGVLDGEVELLLLWLMICSPGGCLIVFEYLFNEDNNNH